ncbi:MAG: DUF1579 domain-containing protein [Ignavibacteriae bacterium]|nr:MAG: DUF1579 domain-containing protein [Ignavibacteriota bacterium]
MKRSMVLFGVLMFLIVGVVHSPSDAQKKKGQSEKRPSQEEMMARMTAAMTPGDAHKKLEYFCGKWNVESKAWMNGPDTPPSVSKGTAEYKMVFGGRFVEQDYTGEMMQGPFTGVGFTGFDNMKKKYESFWIDNMGTAMSIMEGKMDPSGKTLTFFGRMDDPMTGQKNKEFKYVLQIVDDNTHTFAMYDPGAKGGKKPSFLLTYTREK